MILALQIETPALGAAGGVQALREHLRCADKIAGFKKVERHRRHCVCTGAVIADPLRLRQNLLHSRRQIRAPPQPHQCSQSIGQRFNFHCRHIGAARCCDRGIRSAELPLEISL